MHDALRVAHQCHGIGGNEHFLFADAENNWTTVARNDNAFRPFRIDDSETGTYR
jgi:hypothetical protein